MLMTRPAQRPRGSAQVAAEAHQVHAMAAQAFVHPVVDRGIGDARHGGEDLLRGDAGGAGHLHGAHARTRGDDHRHLRGHAAARDSSSRFRTVRPGAARQAAQAERTAAHAPGTSPLVGGARKSMLRPSAPTATILSCAP